jgi:asparagine synthase (glutamine-hydrolysing)
MYAAKTAGSDVTVFTVKFEDTNPEELNCAAAVARRLGLKHIVLSPSLGDFMSDLARMVWYCDEPVADPAFYSAMKVAEAASSIVKVLLSGTGGDELFGGYYHYWLNRKRRLWTSLPRWLTSSQAAHMLCSLLGRGSIWSDLETFRDSRFLWHCKAMSNLGPAERQLLQNHIPTSRDPFAKMRVCFEKTSRCDIVNRQLFTDFCTYLPDQLLTMLDRTTMSASIEGRVPFLDHRLSEIMFRVRGNFKLGNGSEYKALLKTLGRDVLPREVIHRQKMGFPCGALDWLGKDLVPLLEKLLLAKDTFAREYLPAKWLREMCRSPESIRKNERTLYTILVLQIWYELFIKRELCESPEISVLEMFGMKPL